MENRSQTYLNSEEWITIRDFTDSGTGKTLPKYEAKYVDGVDKEFIDTEIVLVKETSAILSQDRMYHLPREVFETVVDQLR